jgi:uncharacterized protein YjbJ (UPF0337 family)
MSTTQTKAKIAVDKAKGKTKAAAGKVLGDHKLTAKGKGLQGKGELRSAAAKVKDVAASATKKAMEKSSAVAKDTKAKAKAKS